MDIQDHINNAAKKKNYGVFFFGGTDPLLVSPQHAAKVKIALQTGAKFVSLGESLYATSSISALVYKPEPCYTHGQEPKTKEEMAVYKLGYYEEQYLNKQKKLT